MIKTSIGTPDIQGKVGGIVYRRDQCRYHIQSLPHDRVGYREWTPQQKCFKRANKYYNSILDAFQLIHYEAVLGGLFVEGGWIFVGRDYRHFVSAWGVYAKHHPVKTKKGNIIYHSIRMVFMSVNIRMCLWDLPLQANPPPPGTSWFDPSAYPWGK